MVLGFRVRLWDIGYGGDESEFQTVEIFVCPTVQPI